MPSNGLSRKTKIALLLFMAVILSAAIFYIRGFIPSGRGEKAFLEGKEGNMRILYVGMDGLDPQLLDTFMEKGYLPNFKKLAAEGSFKRLSTSNPPQSPVAWTSMATGKNPGKHGVFDFIHRDNNYMLHLSILKEKRDAVSALAGTGYVRPYEEKAFWERLSENGIPSVVLRWPLTFPPPKQAGYKLLSGLGVPDVNGLMGRYTFFYTDEAMDLQDKTGRYVKLPRASAVTTQLEAGRGVLGNPLKVPLSISIDNEKRTIELAVQKNRWSGSEGQWSPWLPVEFKVGFIKGISSICKFYVVSVAPELRLYVTSIQFDPANPYFPISTPEGYSKEIVEELGEYFPTLGMPEDTKAFDEGALTDRAFLEQSYETLRVQERILSNELKQFKKGLLAVVFDTSDRVQHMFWRGMKTNPVIKVDEDNPILKIYKHMDGIVANILPHIDENTVLIISSDHGFANFDYSVNMNTFLLDAGFLALKQGATGAERKGLLQAVDWSKTRAYAIGFNSIYLNLKGREKHGIVDSSEAPKLAGEIIGKLKQLKHRDVFAVENVYRKEDIYKGEHISEAPDLIVGLGPGYRYSWQTALGGVPEGDIFSVNDRRWSGDHCADYILVPGIILSNKKIKKENPQLMDIAATILKHAGVQAEGLDGEALF